MADSILDKVGLSQVGEYLGNGSLTGAAIGGGAALLAAATGLSGGWLAWLLVPLAAILGGVVGDAVAQDGPAFGPKGVVKPKLPPAPQTVPEGYVAKSRDSYAIGVSSKHVKETGLAQNMYAEWKGLDLKGDPRLEALKVEARKHGAKFPKPDRKDFNNDSEYRDAVRKREKSISDLIVKDIGTTYGEYSHQTVSGGGNNEEKRAYKAGENPRLAAMDKHSLVCRHYAPVTCLLLEEAGIPSHLMSSETNYFRQNQTRRLELEFVESTPNGGHAYVITDEGNAVIEATTAGQEGWDSRTYRPIHNGVTWEDIALRGKAAIIGREEQYEQFNGRRVIYGGHNGDGAHGAEDAMRESVRTYNQDTRAKATFVGESLDKLGKVLHLSGISNAGQSILQSAPLPTPVKPAEMPAAPKR